MLRCPNGHMLSMGICTEECAQVAEDSQCVRPGTLDDTVMRGRDWKTYPLIADEGALRFGPLRRFLEGREECDTDALRLGRDVSSLVGYALMCTVPQAELERFAREESASVQAQLAADKAAKALREQERKCRISSLTPEQLQAERRRDPLRCMRCPRCQLHKYTKSDRSGRSWQEDGSGCHRVTANHDTVNYGKCITLEPGPPTAPRGKETYDGLRWQLRACACSCHKTALEGEAWSPAEWRWMHTVDYDPED